MGKRVYISQIKKMKGKDNIPVREGDEKISDPDSPTRWHDDVKYAAVSAYMDCGNLTTVATKLKIPYITIKMWRKSKWWDEFTRAIRGDKNVQLNHRIERIMNKSLDAMEERVMEGDSQYNPATGDLMRVPVKAQVLNAITANLSKQRIDLAKLPSEHQEADKDATNARLRELATAFTAFVKGKTKKEVEVENEFEVLTDGTIIDTNGEEVSADRILYLDKKDRE